MQQQGARLLSAVLATADDSVSRSVMRDYLTETSNARRVSTSLRFLSGQAVLDNKAVEDFSRISEIVRATNTKAMRFWCLASAIPTARSAPIWRCRSDVLKMSGRSFSMKTADTSILPTCVATASVLSHLLAATRRPTVASVTGGLRSGCVQRLDGLGYRVGVARWWSLLLIRKDSICCMFFCDFRALGLLWHTISPQRSATACSRYSIG